MSLETQLMEKDTELAGLRTANQEYIKQVETLNSDIGRIRDLNGQLLLKVGVQNADTTGTVEKVEEVNSPSPVQSWESFMADF